MRGYKLSPDSGTRIDSRRSANHHCASIWVSGRRPPSPRTCDGDQICGSVMPVPIMAPQAGAEFRPAAEAELLYAVVGVLAERECIIESQRPEWGFPNYSHAHRAAHMHGVVHRTRHRVGDARTEGRTETTRDDLAGRGECRRTGIIPERAGIGEGGNLDPRILGQEVERRLQLETGAPYTLLVIGIGVVAALLLWVVIYRTKFGVMLRATSQDRRMASALGINVGLVYMSAFAIGCFMAGPRRRDHRAESGGGAR